MKRRFLTKQVIGYSIVGSMLVLLSAPGMDKVLALTHVHHGALTHHHRSVPTLGAAVSTGYNSAPNGTTPTQSNKPSVSPPSPPSANPPAGPTPNPGPNQGQPKGPMDSATPNATPTNPQPLYRTGKLRVHVINGRTMKPLPGAEVVLIETEQRLTTDKDGYTKWFEAPIVRNPRYRPLIQELHGQLGVVVYKNGYRDSVHLGIRIHDDAPAQTTVWMYKIGPGDTRIEPVLYEEPYHHLWLIDLADRFRSKSQPGEGFQHP